MPDVINDLDFDENFAHEDSTSSNSIEELNSIVDYSHNIFGDLDVAENIEVEYSTQNYDVSDIIGELI